MMKTISGQTIRMYNELDLLEKYSIDELYKMLEHQIRIENYEGARIITNTLSILGEPYEYKQLK